MGGMEEWDRWALGRESEAGEIFEISVLKMVKPESEAPEAPSPSSTLPPLNLGVGGAAEGAHRSLLLF